MMMMTKLQQGGGESTVVHDTTVVIMMAKLNKEGDDDDQAPTRRGVHRGERLASSCRHNHENSSIILPLPLFLNIIIIFPLNTKRDFKKEEQNN